MRSAKGLNAGEVALTYTAPLAGSARIGLTDNIESRLGFVFESAYADFYFHTLADSSRYNYAFILGATTSHNGKQFIYSGGTVDLRVSKYVRPYVNNIILTDFSKLYNQVSLGAEVQFLLASGNSFFIVPEVTYMPEINDVSDLDLPFAAAIGLGIRFNLWETVKGN